MSKFTVRKDKDHPYLTMNKTGLQDAKLSWKAKGILAYLLSLPDDRQIYITELINHSTDWRDSTSAGIRELIKNGYIVRSQIKVEKGHFWWYDYDIYEKPVTENPSTGKPKTGKQTLLSKKKTNKDSNNKKDLSKDKAPDGAIVSVQKKEKKTVSKKKRKPWGNEEINEMIEFMKKTCAEQKIPLEYRPWINERWFVRHIVNEKNLKFRTAIAKYLKEWKTIFDFVRGIIFMSSHKYVTTADCPEIIYKERASIINQYKKLNHKSEWDIAEEEKQKQLEEQRAKRKLEEQENARKKAEQDEQKKEYLLKRDAEIDIIIKDPTRAELLAWLQEEFERDANSVVIQGLANWGYGNKFVKAAWYNFLAKYFGITWEN